MYTEDDLLPISGLQHLLFCERRAALVHTEGLWDENVPTAEGGILHEHAHEAETELRGDVRIARGLRLRSLRLGLTGMADVVEFRRVADDAQTNGVRLVGVDGMWRPFIVEYKRGRLRHEESYEIQLCAQAICMEETLHVRIDSGALFYGKTRRRLDIAFSDDLRNRMEAAAARLHELLESNTTPKAQKGPKCEQCSLLDLCLPRVTGAKREVAKYLAKAMEDGGNPP